MREQKPWGAEEAARLVQLRERDGLSFAEIAKQLGRTKNSCLGKYEGVKRQRTAPSEPPHRAPLRFFSPDEDAIIRRGAAEGMTSRQVADLMLAELGSERTASKVRTRAGVLGVRLALDRRTRLAGAVAQVRVRAERTREADGRFVAQLPASARRREEIGSAPDGSVILTDLWPGRCKFWVGRDAQGRDRFCGGAVAGGERPSGALYCAEHQALCVVPPREQPVEPVRARHQRSERTGR